jgi:hypothetical protein
MMWRKKMLETIGPCLKGVKTRETLSIVLGVRGIRNLV